MRTNIPGNVQRLGKLRQVRHERPRNQNNRVILRLVLTQPGDHIGSLSGKQIFVCDPRKQVTTFLLAHASNEPCQICNHWPEVFFIIGETKFAECVRK